ncbi:glucose-6-phosphate dehydrogenase [Opitutaceae bacterium TAV4]|nr:glucose-6-phosphate dehydrogenase [Opitutaceae bacterium TAV4]RRK00570.1 glucose-6-phosphate dehydrogenase [Opitutaceae bacterium TAV3]
MPAIFNALPGIEVPVGAISKSLADLWSNPELTGLDPSAPATPSDDVKATQVNFVLHLGFQTTQDDALLQFRIAVEFSRRYPCRVVVLCPMRYDEEGTDIRAKIYGECHTGKTRGDLRCCEFVLLSYPMSARKYLEDQVSTCLSTDLPLYYWVHRFTSSSRFSDYRYLLGRSKRVMYDSAIAPADVMTFDWPNPDAVRDLAHARLLPIRQSIGQFLASYEPGRLVDDLRGIRVQVGAAVVAEARALLHWAEARLRSCGAPAGLPLHLNASPKFPSDEIELRFDYGNGHHFHWTGQVHRGCAQLSADYGHGLAEAKTAINLLPPEAALAEAMFF